MAGSTGDEEALRLGREAAAFYNAFFFDYDEGSVYFNVLANGIPYLLGTERQKGSHSMAGYHSFELAYLATVYTNLLITKEPMDLYFSPIPGELPDDILRVSPDILPPGSIRIGEVEVDGKPYADFDADELTVHVPEGKKRVKIRVRIVPTIDPFEVRTEFKGDERRDDPDRQARHEHVRDLPGRGRERPGQEAEAPRARCSQDLDSIANVGIRVLLFARQRMDIADRADIYAVAPEAGGPRGAPAGRSGPGGHQRRRELRPVPGRRPDRQEADRLGIAARGAGESSRRLAHGSGGWSSSTKPWLISTMLPSGSATQTVRQPGMNASKSMGPAVIFASAPMSASLASTSSTLNARWRQPGYSGPGPAGAAPGPAASP